MFLIVTVPLKFHSSLSLTHWEMSSPFIWIHHHCYLLSASFNFRGTVIWTDWCDLKESAANALKPLQLIPSQSWRDFFFFKSVGFVKSFLFDCTQHILRWYLNWNILAMDILMHSQKLMWNAYLDDAIRLVKGIIKPMLNWILSLLEISHYYQTSDSAFECKEFSFIPLPIHLINWHCLLFNVWEIWFLSIRNNNKANILFLERSER